MGLDPPPLENARAVKHGATAALQLAPRAEAIAEQLREITPVPSDSDGDSGRNGTEAVAMSDPIVLTHRRPSR